MKKTNWALIGYGGMGEWHVEKLRSMADFCICGVYDLLPQRCELAKDCGLRVYASLQELLEDETIELVTIATPNDVHKPLAIQAMNAGKNVICEKPVTLSSSDLQEMFDVSRRTGKLLTVHQNRRWDEDYLTMKKIYEENMLGRVFRIESRVHGSRGVPGDWRNHKQYGGGMILDWGVHLLDQVLQMIPQPIVEVYCQTTHVTNSEVDDGFTTTLTFADGLNVQVEVGTSNFISLPRWYMLGENGSAIIEDWSLRGKIVKVSDWEKRDAVPVVTAAGLTKTMAPRTEETIREYELPLVQSDVRDFYRNCAAVLHEGASQLVKHEQMMRVMRLMEAMVLSAEQHQVVKERI